MYVCFEKLKSNGTHRKVTIWDVYTQQHCIDSSNGSGCGYQPISFWQISHQEIDCQLYLILAEMGNVGPPFSPIPNIGIKAAAGNLAHEVFILLHA